MPELESHDVLVHRARMQRALGAMLTLSALVGTVICFTSDDFSAQVLWFLGSLPLLFAGPMTWAAAGRDPNTRGGRRGGLRVADGALHVDAKGLVITPAEIEGAWVEEDFVGGTLVVETRRGVTVAARFLDDQRAQASALLEALAVDSRLVVLRLAAAERSERGCAGGCLTFAALVGLFPIAVVADVVFNAFFGGSIDVERFWIALVPALFCVVAMLVAARTLSSTTVRLGADGVRLGRRFVAFEDLVDVKHAASSIELVTERGTHRVRCLGVQAAAVIARIKDGHARYAANQGVELSLLDRGERTIGEWRAALARWADAPSYREQAIDRSQLLGLVENPQATRERRAGAMLALGSDMSPFERQRLRIACDTCAEPDTRAVLEAALDEELVALDEALRRSRNRT